MKRRTFVTAASASGIAAALSACSTPTPGGASDGGSGEERKAPFTIGVSNAFVGSEYRTQMIDDIKTVFEEYKKQDLVDELVLENADADVNGQIQQIRNLINKGVDAIIVDPNSASALTAVFQEAIGQGIKVYAIDQAVDAEEVTNIGIDQGELAKASAEWFAEHVTPNAKIAIVAGTAGNPATEARGAAAQKVFDEAGITVVATADGGWDQATGQTVAGDLLSAYPDIAGIWTYDGMAQGVLRAVQAANRQADVLVGGEARVGFMRMWNDIKDTGFQSVGIVNPPGTGATALHFALNELQGKTIDASKVTDGHTVVLPLQPAITNENFAAEWEKVKDKDDTYVLDSVLTADEVAAYFG